MLRFNLVSLLIDTDLTSYLNPEVECYVEIVGRGVVVKLVISLTLKGEINNITLNNTLWSHYTTVYRLATTTS